MSRLASLSPLSRLPRLAHALLFAVLGALSFAADSRAELLALCGAYPPELTALRDEFGATEANGFTKETFKGVTFWRGRVGRHDVVLFRTGTSVVNAAYQLQLALDHLPITAVLFAGVAGGTDPKLRVGDIVVPERWAYHDESAYLNDDGHGGYVKPDYLTIRHEHFGMIHPDDVAAVRDGAADYETMPVFPIDPALLDATRRAIAKLPKFHRADHDVAIHVGGTGVTGSVFLDNRAYREWLQKVWSARCTDMESTALAHVAWCNRVPILIVRGLSDLAGGQHGANPIDANELPVSRVAAKVLRQVVDEL
ncbi:MAG: 5'-methylthioadenosine/S-adenosylhomocysteine nucleosidase [Candidatus Didemnitutus sp.]|nr:5'-methylthioadenosine/S-adenosylhomocysteine nucleosidase [Candidatus Didemnitutus sp.]